MFTEMLVAESLNGALAVDRGPGCRKYIGISRTDLEIEPRSRKT